MGTLLGLRELCWSSCIGKKTTFVACLIYVFVLLELCFKVHCAVVTVIDPSDPGSVFSLRSLVANANAGDTINFSFVCFFHSIFPIGEVSHGFLPKLSVLSIYKVLLLYRLLSRCWDLSQLIVSPFRALLFKVKV